MGNIPGRENIVDEIKSGCDIVEVIGRVVPLKRAGGNFKGLCPFHSEKTPSFVVSETKQIFYCFGCNASGDVIGFVQQYYNLDFPAAMEKLGEEYGIDTRRAYYKAPEKEKLYEINREAARFFYRAFAETPNPALSYMTERGVERAVLNKFGIGYADGEWDSLYQHFQTLGTDRGLLLSLGLISESKGKHYDRFRNRVMFPIINTSGKVIGFGGRVLGEGEPKYLNSAESAVFLKKNNLFGLNITRQAIGKENAAVLVEGYMDVLSLYQSGIRNVAASLGTALTENQAKLLARYTPNVALAYDADAAGQAAALRGGEVLRGEGCKAKILQIPSEKDPDDFVRKNGKNAFSLLVDAAPAYLDFRLRLMKQNHDMTSTDGKVDYIKEVVALLKTVSPVEAEAYMKSVAADTKISESAIRLEYSGGVERPARPPETKREDSWNEGDMARAVSGLEKNLLKLALTERAYVEKIQPHAGCFVSGAGAEIWAALQLNYERGEELDHRSLADSLGAEAGAALRDIQEHVRFAGKEDQILADCVNTIERDALSRKERELIVKLSMAEDVEDKETVRALTRELMEVQRKARERKR